MSLPWLNARSHFSLGESLATPKELVEAAAKAGLTAICLTDTMTVSGMPELFTAAQKAGVKPMIGVRLRIVPELVRDKKLAKRQRAQSYFLRALILDETGWTKTLGLLSTAFDEEHFYERPRLLLRDVLEAYRGGGVVLTLGDAYSALQAGTGKAVGEGCRDYGIPLYADLSLSLTPLAVRTAYDALTFGDRYADELGIMVWPLISPPALYTETSQADSLDMMGAVASNRPWSELSPRHPYRAHVVRPVRELGAQMLAMAKALQARYGSSVEHWREKLVVALKRTQALPGDASFTWDKQAPSLPKMSDNEFAALVKACTDGWTARFDRQVFGHSPGPADLDAYRDRLRHELRVVKQLGFSAYFLLVAEITGWAKAQGIKVGPGRGSVGGSLIAYLLGVTDVDPIRFGLLFERFINPERIDLPDADLDFASLRREEVVRYIIERFGEPYVAGVVNYNTLQAAGALKDVCRMLGVPNIPAFSKLVPKEHGISYSIDEALDEVPELVSFASANPEVMRHARNLEGRIRAFGKHAAGLIVAGVPIRERAVIERRNGAQVINWDKRLAEEFGLVKMDILGLSTLDMLDISLDEVKHRHGKRVDLLAVPLDDPKTLEAFGRGETVGVFQFESAGMRRLLKDLARGGTLCFEDLAVATALYRPGPMDSGLMDDFVKIRQGSRAEGYDHPSMVDALRETKGVMVYQEQVMQVARDFAGFSMPESDHLRKAMGKKDAVKMASYRDKFVQGAVELHGVDPHLAEVIFDRIAKFAAYGFNKSHAVEYALISYQAMYLKAHFPVEFWAGVMTMLKDERRDMSLADMKRMGVSLLPPDINNSTDRFTALNDVVLLAPFSAVKGITERSAGAIMAERAANGPFKSLADVTARIAGKLLNSGQRAKLDLVGAFSRIETGQLPADHHSRRRDQMELMSGLIADAVVVDREPDLSPTAIQALTETINAYKACERCELRGLCHPKPRVVGPVKAMAILDGPGYREEAADEMGHGGHAEALAQSLEQVGLTLDDLYITSLIKSPKPGKGAKWSTTTLGECPAWLEEELRILKPPVVIVLGSETFYRFHKGLKGGLNEHAGRVIYDKDRDLNWLIGVNPSAIYFDPGKQVTLDAAIAKLPDLLPV